MWNLPEAEHGVKSVCIRSFAGPNFPEFGMNTEKSAGNDGFGHIYWRNLTKIGDVIHNHF